MKFKNASQRCAVIAKYGTKYNVTSFHPTAFEKGVHTVSFHKQGTMLVDKNKRLVQVTSRDPKTAIKKALETREVKDFMEQNKKD